MTYFNTNGTVFHINNATGDFNPGTLAVVGIRIPVVYGRDFTSGYFIGVKAEGQGYWWCKDGAVRNIRCCISAGRATSSTCE